MQALFVVILIGGIGILYTVQTLTLIAATMMYHVSLVMLYAVPLPVDIARMDSVFSIPHPHQQRPLHQIQFVVRGQSILLSLVLLAKHVAQVHVVITMPFIKIAVIPLRSVLLLLLEQLVPDPLQPMPLHQLFEHWHLLIQHWHLLIQHWHQFNHQHQVQFVVQIHSILSIHVLLVKHAARINVVIILVIITF